MLFEYQNIRTYVRLTFWVLTFHKSWTYGIAALRVLLLLNNLSPIRHTYVCTYFLLIMDYEVDNKLGEMATACAQKYCKILDGLELWLSIYKYCTSDDNENDQEKSAWTSLNVGFLCSGVSIIGVALGFFTVNMYNRYRNREYETIPSSKERSDKWINWRPLWQ